MKAAILVESKQPLVIDEIHLPESLEFGQVLVDVHYSGICGAQINEINAAKGPDKFLPHLLGHEGSGVVKEVGLGVSTVKKGDHVALSLKVVTQPALTTFLPQLYFGVGD
jgi:Zn-dependent alcohol dehydrogenase